MGLFPKEQTAGEFALNDTPRRMLWTRELGTRKLLFALATVAVIWIGAGRVLDQMLLSKHWAPLSPTLDGLTVVGTLNARGQYDRNLLRIVTANKASRVELTDYGWNSIFDPRNGPLCDEKTSSAIEKARSVDSEAAYGLLEPFLYAEIAKESGDKSAYQHLGPDLPIHIAGDSAVKTSKAVDTTIGKLVQRFSADDGGTDVPVANDTPEGGSGSGRQSEHGVTLPADTVARVCPVILTGPQFSDAWLEEQPANAFTGKAYTVHLGLTKEGRSRFFQWSHAHANEGYAFVLGHQVVLGGLVPETLDVSDLDIKNVQDEQTAKQLVDWINNRKHTDG